MALNDTFIKNSTKHSGKPSGDKYTDGGDSHNVCTARSVFARIVLVRRDGDQLPIRSTTPSLQGRCVLLAACIQRPQKPTHRVCQYL